MSEFTFELKDKQALTIRLTLTLEPGFELTEHMKSEAENYVRELFHDLEGLAVEVVTQHGYSCEKCDGHGSIDYPNISGYDYSERCQACNGKGVIGE